MGRLGGGELSQLSQALMLRKLSSDPLTREHETVKTVRSKGAIIFMRL